MAPGGFSVDFSRQTGDEDTVSGSPGREGGFGIFKSPFKGKHMEYNCSASELITQCTS